MKKNKISKNWINKQKRDPFFKKSKSEGYRSRSAYKLIELDKKYNLIKKNINIIDLGSSPGGWSQVVSKKINNGKILSIDIKKMEKIEGVNFINEDFNTHGTQKKIVNFFNSEVDLIVSDMAANTSGNKELDSFRTGELCLNAMDLSIKLLSKNGIFVSKLFMGSIFKEIKEKAKNNFKNVSQYKPISSKKESKEIYIICKGILKV